MSFSALLVIPICALNLGEFTIPVNFKRTHNSFVTRHEVYLLLDVSESFIGRLRILLCVLSFITPLGSPPHSPPQVNAAQHFLLIDSNK